MVSWFICLLCFTSTVSLIGSYTDVESNRPFPSSPEPPFQSEAKWEVCYENQFSFILKVELIILTKISYLDSL